MLASKLSILHTSKSGRRFESRVGDGDSYGAHYDHNIAAEADVRGALGAAYDDETRPAIAACVAAVHARAGRGLPAGAFVFVGFDFIVDDGGAPWLLEANVKPAARYADVDAQFQSPVARRRAGNDRPRRANLETSIEVVSADFWTDRCRSSSSREKRLGRTRSKTLDVVATLLGFQVRRLAAAALADLARVVDGGAAPGPGPSWVPLPRGGGEGPAG